MLKARGISQNIYAAFYPLHKLKGRLKKMGPARLRKRNILMHLNPIEGNLIVYNSERKFPYSPSKIF